MVEDYTPPWVGGRPNQTGALVNVLRYRNEWEMLGNSLTSRAGPGPICGSAIQSLSTFWIQSGRSRHLIHEI